MEMVPSLRKYFFVFYRPLVSNLYVHKKPYRCSMKSMYASKQDSLEKMLKLYFLELLLMVNVGLCVLEWLFRGTFSQ